jgi:hypothetical protein
MLMQMIVSRRDRPNRMQGVPGNARAHIRDTCGLHPFQPGIGIRIGWLENEVREISSKMNDVLARATCDLKDDSRHWQDIAKDIENEIPIA